MCVVSHLLWPPMPTSLRVRLWCTGFRAEACAPAGVTQTGLFYFFCQSLFCAGCLDLFDRENKKCWTVSSLVDIFHFLLERVEKMEYFCAGRVESLVRPFTKPRMSRIHSGLFLSIVGDAYSFSYKKDYLSIYPVLWYPHRAPIIFYCAQHRWRGDILYFPRNTKK